MRWSDKDPREILPLGIDLAPLLATGDSLIAAEATIAVALGTDPNAASMLLSACEIVGTTVQQWLQGGVSGCRYQLTFQADTDVGKRIIETAELAVVTR
jgi:hypothetical protein